MWVALTLGIAGIVATGCAIDTPDAPVVVSGTLVDEMGQPVPGARVFLDVVDDRVARPGQVLPVAFHAETTSGADGRFEIRALPTEAMRRRIGANTGFVNFTLGAVDQERGLFWGWDFPREMGLEGWVDDATTVRLVPVDG